MGKALKDGYRNKVFLMTKIDAHTARAANQQLEESMRRLQAETIDLLQFHEVIRMTDRKRYSVPAVRWKQCWPQKKAGKIRYIGFTGHKSPDIHLKMLQTAQENNFLFDTVQMPLNVMDYHYDSFERRFCQ